MVISRVLTVEVVHLNGWFFFNAVPFSWFQSFSKAQKRAFRHTLILASQNRHCSTAAKGWNYNHFSIFISWALPFPFCVGHNKNFSILLWTQQQQQRTTIAITTTTTVTTIKLYPHLKQKLYRSQTAEQRLRVDSFSLYVHWCAWERIFHIVQQHEYTTPRMDTNKTIDQFHMDRIDIEADTLVCEHHKTKVKKKKDKKPQISFCNLDSGDLLYIIFRCAILKW